MKIRPLILDDEFRKQVAQVEQFAKEHPYIPGETEVPGDDPRYCITTTFGYRCVFSYTRTLQGFYRDLSISVDEKYPNKFAAFTLAQEFGFTGWNQTSVDLVPEGWMIAKDIHYDAIRIVQQIAD